MKNKDVDKKKDYYENNKVDSVENIKHINLYIISEMKNIKVVSLN